VLFLLLAVFSGFNFNYLLSALVSSKDRERPKTLFRVQLWLQSKYFLLFKFGNFSAISRVVVVLVTIVTPKAGPLMTLRRLAYTNSNIFTYSYYLLVVRKDWDRWCV
jgi:hypothetical protein